LHGMERSDFLGNALAVLMPTRYVEPFGGVTVEAHLCGTPVLGSSYGSFTETIEHNINGFNCRTLGDFLTGLDKIENNALNRVAIRERAIQKYNMYNVAHEYNKVFMQVSDLRKDGWYTRKSHWV
jgi:glycosyltransferase involved in cell wall biosynthesis